MEMTLNEYILNPMLKNNAILNATAREAIRIQYTSKWDNILLRENGKINYYLYTDSNNRYWVHIKVPSELVPNFYYDVIFKFSPTQSTGGGNDLFKFNVQFFSNDPAFVYYFAYAFRKNNLFIDELRSKMSKEALTTPPKEKNPTESIGYVKTIYFAYLLLKERGLNKLLRFNGESKALNPQLFISMIEDADSKIKSRQELGSKISKKKKAVISNTALKNLKAVGGKNIDLSGTTIKTTKRIGAKKSTVKTTKSSPFTKKK